VRILMVNKFGYLRGGAERYMFRMSELLTASGNQVEFFFMQHPQNLPQTYTQFFPPQLEFRRSGSLSAAWRTVWNRRAASDLARVLDDFQPDIVHMHNIRYHLSASITKVLRDRHIPTVQTLHDYGSICPAHHLFRAGQVCERCPRYGLWAAPLSRCMFKSTVRSGLGALAEGWDRWGGYTADAVSAFICPSRFLLEKLAHNGMNRLVYLPHFVSIPSEPAKGDGDYILYLGRLNYEKGPDILLKAMSKIPKVRLKMAGTGEMETQLKLMAGEMGIVSRVEFLGQVGDREVAGLLNHALMLVFPSRVYENAPLAIFEALAAGVPVVASHPGGAVELVEGCGVTFPSGDASALAAAVNHLLQSPQQRAELGNRGRQRAQMEWTAEKHLAGLSKIYEDAMNRRDAPRCAPTEIPPKGGYGKKG
jgi:glycosyltransferase involved in cell wall biosynthesis